MIITQMIHLINHLNWLWNSRIITKHVEFVFKLHICVSVSARYDAAIVGLVRLGSIAVAAFLMDKAGRKALLYTSSMLMFLSSLTLTMVSHTTPCPPGPAPPNHTAPDYTSHNDFGSTFMSNAQTAGSVLPIICTVVFIFGEFWKQQIFNYLFLAVSDVAVRGAKGEAASIKYLSASHRRRLLISVKNSTMQKVILSVRLYSESTWKSVLPIWLNLLWRRQWLYIKDGLEQFGVFRSLFF